MTPATQEKTETKFTCLGGQGEIVVVRAKNPADADKEVIADLIVEGTLKDIGAKKIDEAPEGGIWAGKIELEAGNLCTLIVGDPMIVADATFLSEEEIGDNPFLAWQKNGILFWTYEGETYLTYVGGRRVGTRSD